MKNLKQKKIRYLWKTVFLPVMILVCMITLLYYGLQEFTAINREQELILTEQSIRKAAIQCYANEGMYPADLEYLTDNYYLNINEDKYYVYYECWGSNILPDISVYEK